MGLGKKDRCGSLSAQVLNETMRLSLKNYSKRPEHVKKKWPKADITRKLQQKSFDILYKVEENINTSTMWKGVTILKRYTVRNRNMGASHKIIAKLKYPRRRLGVFIPKSNNLDWTNTGKPIYTFVYTCSVKYVMSFCCGGNGISVNCDAQPRKNTIFFQTFGFLDIWNVLKQDKRF